MNYYIYLIIAVLCFVGEMFTMDFALACFGLGFVAAAVASLLGLGLVGQVFIFAIISLLCFFGIRPLAKKYFYRKDTPNSNVDALVGREITLLEPLEAPAFLGRLKVEGDEWRIQSTHAMPAGTKAIIEKIDGATLIIKKK